MTNTTALESLGGEKYVRLTTFRKDGTPVPTPVWLVRDGDHLLVTTVDGTGKVKRIRNTPRVTLTPCDQRGRVAPAAVEVEGTAEVVTDAAEQERLWRMLVAKYGLFARVLGLVGRLRRSTAARVELRISL